jgi:hypothetical protein
MRTILRDEPLVTITIHTQHTNALFQSVRRIVKIAKNIPTTPKEIDVPRVILSLFERPEDPVISGESDHFNEFCVLLFHTSVSHVGHSYITVIRNNVLSNGNNTICPRKCDIVVILGGFANCLVFV